MELPLRRLEDLGTTSRVGSGPGDTSGGRVERGREGYRGREQGREAAGPGRSSSTSSRSSNRTACHPAVARRLTLPSHPRPHRAHHPQQRTVNIPGVYVIGIVLAYGHRYCSSQRIIADTNPYDSTAETTIASSENACFGSGRDTDTLYVTPNAFLERRQRVVEFRVREEEQGFRVHC